MNLAGISGVGGEAWVGRWRGGGGRAVATNTEDESMVGSLCAEFTCARLVMPSTKHMESKMLDFPLPFRPVMALNLGSKLGIVTRVA